MARTATVSGFLTSTKLLKLADCGIRYRQLDYYVRAGAITPARQADGSGHFRGWLVDDRLKLRRLARWQRLTQGDLNLEIVRELWEKDPTQGCSIQGAGCLILMPPEQ